MVENLENRRKPGDETSFDSPKPEEEIIELSEMTVGISQEDEAIIELTEEIVGGAFEGFSRVTGEIKEEEEILDLSRANGADSDEQVTAPAEKKGRELTGGLMDIEKSEGDSIDAIEKDIARELDNYFQLEEETRDLLSKVSPPKVTENESTRENILAESEGETVTYDRFEAALEEVIRRMFGEKIDRILNEVIERTVSDEIEQLKEILVKRLKRND